MTSLSALWLPILLSAVFVFIASSVLHMATPWHKNDYRSVPQEEQVTAALRPLAIPPGDYMVPRPKSMDQMRSPEFAEQMRQGPVLVMSVLPNGMTPMGGLLVKWFIYLLVVSFIAGGIAAHVLPPNTDSHVIVHLTGMAAFLAYSLALWQMAIWYRRSLGTTIRATIDGLVYGLITGATFAWLWPR
jgi:hypothetical protein